ncbi:MAG TPA: glycosyltransferase [Lachnospiraceae bacterium]|nr:glycosyltransferase [Lachnospiraceae bacterium]
MKLSIIVPVYNMEADGKLNYCLDSLLMQTISDYEIIGVDDCSTDNSLDILKDYEKKYPDRVIAIHSSVNKKQGGARNIGIKRARGEWIGFVDSDDWIAPTMYEELLTKAQETGADVVGCDYNLVTSHTMEVGKMIANNSMDQTGVLEEEKHKKLLMRPGSMVIKVYKSSVIREHNLCFPEHIFYEDNCAGPIWMLHFNHFEKVEKPLYYYYQFEDSTVHHISVKKCEDRMTAGQLLVDWCKQSGYSKTYYKELEFRFCELYYVNTLFTYVIGMKHPKLSFLRRLAQGMKREFPDFQENAYYLATFDEEQKRLIGYHMKSSLYFIMYYKALTTYRKYKKRISG